jgi:hypothetical protein
MHAPSRRRGRWRSPQRAPSSRTRGPRRGGRTRSRPRTACPGRLSPAVSCGHGKGGRHARSPAMSTDTTSPYTAMIPDMTTGMSDCERGVSRALGGGVYARTFMMSSGLNAPRPAMPMPALDVPYAAPTAARRQHPPSCLPPTLHSLLNIICGGRSATAPGEQGRGTHRGRDACEPEERRPVRALRRDGHD